MERNADNFKSKRMRIQEWNLPVHWLTREVGLGIGGGLKEVFEVLIPTKGGKEGRHLKINVEVDLTQLLLRGMVLRSRGKPFWASFKYERCPDFCFRCGRVGHIDKNCVFHEAIEASDSERFGV